MVSPIIRILAKVKITAEDLQDYEGGDNPILLVMFIIAVIFVALGAIGFFFYLKWHTAQFFQLCEDKDLTQEELGLLQTFGKRFHQRDMLIVIERVGSFDTFSNRLAHHYENTNLSEEEILEESARLQAIRTKLEFDHSYLESRLRSSRSLPLNHPITVTFFDKFTKRSFTFHSKVTSNNEFFLEIEPPEMSINQEISTQKKLQLSIGITRENDAEYYYDSCLVLSVTYPSPRWHIRHSNQLSRGDEHRRINLPAQITISGSGEDTNDEFNVTIVHLNKMGARFTFQDNSISIQTPKAALLNLEVDGQHQLFRIQITEKIKRQDNIYYRTQFKTLEKEETLRLGTLSRQLKERASAAPVLEKTFDKAAQEQEPVKKSPNH